MLHDPSYKEFFAHPKMVQDLLLGFVKEDWVKALDFKTLERVNASFVAKHLRQRHLDIVWKTKWKGVERPPLYIYLMLELQTKNDLLMPFRMMSYLSLLYLDLAKQLEFKKGDLLPPVLPILLYRGAESWEAATEVQRLIAHPPGQLKRYLPRLRYALIEERRYDARELAKIAKPISALFRFEQGAGPDESAHLLDLVLKWLDSPGQESLARAFSVWFSSVYLRSRLPEENIAKIENLFEVRNMMQQNQQTWTQQWKMEGKAEGRQEGLQEGRQEGETTLLTHLLKLKFKTVPPWVRAQLKSATEAQLRNWAGKILRAESLEEVFNSRKCA